MSAGLFMQSCGEECAVLQSLAAFVVVMEHKMTDRVPCLCNALTYCVLRGYLVILYTVKYI